MTKNTQQDRVLDYLGDKGSITSWEAIKEFGITRISAVIFKLKEEGVAIKTQREEAVNRYGDKVSYVRYYL